MGCVKRLALLLLLWPALALAQWSEPVIDGSLRSAALATAPPPVTGTTFYVDGGSIGGTCSNTYTPTQAQNPTLPWCTIGKAVATLTAGQRAYIRGNHTYAEGNLIPANSGTAGNYITLQAYTPLGETQPALNCTGYAKCFAMYVTTGRSYWVLNGLNMYGASEEILMCSGTVGCHHLWVINSKLHDNTAVNAWPCIRMDNTYNNVVSNNEGYGCRANFWGGGAGSHDNIIEFNVIHDNNRDSDDEGAVKCGTNGWACVTRYNLAYDNYRNPSSAVACAASPCLGVTGIYHDFDINLAHGTTSYSYNNVSHDNDAGFQYYESETIRVYNNVAYHNGFTPGQATFGSDPNQPNFGHGFEINQNSGTRDVQLVNNVSYGNWKRGFSFGGVSNTQFLSRNNIGMNNGIDFAYYNFTSGPMDYDLMYNTVGGTLIIFNGVPRTLAYVQANGGTTWDHAINADPLFVDAANHDFRLQATSPARDAGVSMASLMAFDQVNTARPQPVGGAWDIGAYEYQGTNLPPSCAITTDGGTGAGNNFTVTTQPLALLAGTAGDSDGTVSSVAVSCVPSCGSPTVTGLDSWSAANVPLSVGANVLTATATDDDAATCQDSVTVTFNPPPPPGAQFRLIQ